MNCRFVCAILVLAAMGWSIAFGADAADWQALRGHQPPGLHLALTLPKDHFFQGERIEATVVFSNDDAAHFWSVWVGAGSPGAVFHAIDAQGRTLAGPLDWYRDWYPLVVLGPIANHPFGTYSLDLPVNETVRFDAPGVYSLYAVTRVLNGVDPNAKNAADLVSDPVKVTIDPLMPEQEKKTIEEAKQKISANTIPSYDDQNGVAELRYLQTRAARDELIMLLGRPDFSQQVDDGLLGAPDPTEEARQIMQRVRSGKLVLDDSGAELYGELVTYPLIRQSNPVGMPQKEMQARWDAVNKVREAARSDVANAAVSATGGEPTANLEALWSAYKQQAIYRNPGEPDRDGGRARAALAARQLELPADHVKQLLDLWAYWGNDDFLPLVRREAGPPHNNINALVVLAGIRPKEAQKRMEAQLSDPHSPIFLDRYPGAQLLVSMRPQPTTRFDSVLRARLKERRESDVIIPLIYVYGSAALLPDVVQDYETNGKDLFQGKSRTQRRNENVNFCAFRFWFRYDPKGAAGALEEEVKGLTGQRPGDGGGFVCSLLRPWNDALLPIAHWALQNSNPFVVSQGIAALSHHGDASEIDRTISALARMRTDAADADFKAREAASLLKNAHWHYSEKQKARLEAMAANPLH